MRFKGRVAVWFYFVTVLGLLLLGILSVISAFSGEIWALILCLTMMVIFGLYCIPAIFRNYVELRKDCIYISFGFICRKIRYSSVISIYPSSNASFNSPLNKLEIVYEDSTESVLISIYDSDIFFREIVRKNPNIRCPLRIA